ncbi:MAG: uL30 family ribosomal protein [Candidatus Micrarchaeia archaeon]
MSEKTNQNLLALIRIRGLSGLNPKRKSTMVMLNLKRSNQATLVHLNPSYAGMLTECKDYVTWGPISRDVLIKLLAKRATVGKKKLNTLKTEPEIEKIADELIGGKTLKELEINRSIRLTPPSGGWKNKKRRVPQGDLGPRESIDDVIRRMI